MNFFIIYRDEKKRWKILTGKEIKRKIIKNDMLLTFYTEQLANQYKDAVAELHPDRKYYIVKML